MTGLKKLLVAAADYMINDPGDKLYRDRYLVRSHYKSLQDVISAGAYVGVDEFVTAENFNIESGEIVVEGELMLHTTNHTKSDDVVESLNHENLRSATLQELCVLRVVDPDVARNYQIVALGSVGVRPGGRKVVPCLTDHSVWRGAYCPLPHLDLVSWDEEWDYRTLFLVARK